MSSELTQPKPGLDRLGMALSGLCLVHCLLLPLLLALLPLLTISSLPGWLHEAEWFHAVLLVPVVLVSGPVLLKAGRRDVRLGSLALIAFASLISALFASSELAEQILTVFGATLLFLAHWLNLKGRAAQ